MRSPRLEPKSTLPGSAVSTRSAISAATRQASAATWLPRSAARPSAAVLAAKATPRRDALARQRERLVHWLGVTLSGARPEATPARSRGGRPGGGTIALLGGSSLLAALPLDEPNQ
ncbi:MAG: hypothetical protein U1F49_09775 [Rubrivivax sp.]